MSSIRLADRAEAPYYLPVGNEVELFRACHARWLPVMLKGPTGCGKTRFVEHMARRLGRPLITVACHDDLSASDLTGRYLIRGGETVWVDGPLTTAARTGAICYLDEVVEARQDTVVVIHPLTDDRRILPDREDGRAAHRGAGLPARRLVQPRLPARAQGPEAEHAAALRGAGVRLPRAGAGGGDRRRTRAACRARRRARSSSSRVQVRRLRDQGLAEGPGTRLLVSTGG